MRIVRHILLLAVLLGLPLPAQSDDRADELIAAARHGQTAEIESLLAAGVPVDAPDMVGWTPLVWAAAYLHYDAVKLLIDRGADLEAIGRSGKNSGTALMWAAKKVNSRRVVELLLDAGADVNGSDQYGRTAIMLAARHGQVDSIHMLLARGADINAVSRLPRVRTALEQAQKYRKGEVVRLLRSLGAVDFDRLPPERIAAWQAAQAANDNSVGATGTGD